MTLLVNCRIINFKKVPSKIVLIKKIHQISDNYGGIFNRNAKLLCATIVLLTPPSCWYMLTFRTYQFSKYLKFLFKNEAENFERIRLILFLRMLIFLKRTKVAFHVPYEFNSNQIRINSGTLYCTTHLPLIEVGIKALVEHNFPIEVAIAAKPLEDSTISILGMETHFPAIKSDSSVLLKTKSLLSKGASVYVLIDRLELDDLSPNSMKICRIATAKAVFVFTKLDKKGVIQCWLEEAPFPECATDEQIQENLEYLKNRSDSVMQTYLK